MVQQLVCITKRNTKKNAKTKLNSNEFRYFRTAVAVYNGIINIHRIKSIYSKLK